MFCSIASGIYKWQKQKKMIKVRLYIGEGVKWKSDDILRVRDNDIHIKHICKIGRVRLIWHICSI